MSARASVLVLLLFAAWGCDTKDAEKQADTTAESPPSEGATASGAQVQARAAEAAPEAKGGGGATADDAPTEAELNRADAHLKIEHPGPWFLVTARETGVFAEPKADRRNKLAWAKSGGKLAVLPDPVKNDDCKKGWYRLSTGGYICGAAGVLDPDERKSRFTLKPPALEEVLPYRYMRNGKNGTPLYSSIPSREQMLAYEPHLQKKEQKAKTGDEETPEAKATPQTTEVAYTGLQPARSDGSTILARTVGGAEGLDTQREGTQGAGSPDSSAESGDSPELTEAQVGNLNREQVPWWQQEDPKLHELTIEQLAAEGDGILAQRMLKGFYIAVDSSFKWNSRLWYKTTRGYIAPADQFYAQPGPDFKGVEIDGVKVSLPVGWTYGWNKATPLYRTDEKTGNLVPAGTAPRFQMLELTENVHTIRGKQYRELKDGTLILESRIRVTKPSLPPPDLAPGERWVDVNVTEQTVVVFRGNRPVYATLTSTGKTSKIKEKDHSTPVGEWRIREKHITSKMDGDGTAAGDLPYSIDDVPYVMFYHKAYALHGAFWHNDFGNKRSHGCVNLAPLDAKWVFFYTDPPVPHGVHGAFATDGQPGSLVVVHE